MARKKVAKLKTPEEVARDFWAGVFKDLRERLEETESKATDSTSDKTARHERELFTGFSRELQNLPKDAPIPCLKEVLIQHKYLVKPYLPWDRIGIVLSDLNLNREKIEGLVLLLKPVPIEHHLGLLKDTIIQKFEKTIKKEVDRLNEKVKALSPLLKRLEKLSRQREYRGFSPLSGTVTRLRRDIAISKAMVKARRENDKKLLEGYGIDKDPNKSPQRHKYFSTIAVRALRVINQSCHTDACEPHCKKTHKKAYVKIAELLNILYPTIWTQSTDIIANKIKSMEQRQA